MDILELVHEDRSPASRPFHCTDLDCPKSFTRRSDLVRHMRIHTNDRPWVCDWPGCQRDFIQRSALTVHYRVHTGERPHICEYEYCDKAFSDSSSLARHRRIHTGKRPYKCPDLACAKTFCRKTTLTKHIKRHHPHSPSFTHGNYTSQLRFADPPSPASSSEYPHRLAAPYAHDGFDSDQEGYYASTPLPLPDAHTTPTRAYATRKAPVARSAPAKLNHDEIRKHLERQQTGEGAYLTPPPHHPRHMRAAYSDDEYEEEEASDDEDDDPSYAPEEYAPEVCRTPKREFVSPVLGHASPFATPVSSSDYPSTPATSVYSQHSTPLSYHQLSHSSSHQYPPHPHHQSPTFEPPPAQHLSWSVPLPSMEFPTSVPMQHSNTHSGLPHHVSFTPSPSPAYRFRRASSTPALDQPFAPSVTTSSGLGITVTEPEPLLEMRRFSEVAGMSGHHAHYGRNEGPEEYTMISSGMVSPTVGGFLRRGSITGGYSSFMSAHLLKMDEEAGYI